jgi:hypothetical protein
VTKAVPEKKQLDNFVCATIVKFYLHLPLKNPFIKKENMVGLLHVVISKVPNSLEEPNAPIFK